MLRTLILALILIVASALLLAFKVLFVKGGKFPSGHAHDIEALKKKSSKTNSEHRQ